MKKISFLLFLLMVSCCSVFSQDNGSVERNPKCMVFVGDMIIPTKNNVASVIAGILQQKVMVQDASFLPALKDGVIAGLSGVRRLIVQKADNAMMETVRSSSMPCYLVEGVVTDLGNTVDVSKNASKSSYSGIASVMLTLKDLKTGQIVSTNKFNQSCTTYSYDSTPAKAVSGAISYVGGDVFTTYMLIFPVHGSIIEKGEATSDKQKEVYIDLGTAAGVYKGQHFEVDAVQIIAGREAKTKIGELKIIDVKGEDISLCKVSKGGTDIKKAMDKGMKIVIVNK